jgi:hypothetical protein
VHSPLCKNWKMVFQEKLPSTTISVTCGCKRVGVGKEAPVIFFLPKNSFLSYRVEVSNGWFYHYPPMLLAKLREWALLFLFPALPLRYYNILPGTGLNADVTYAQSFAHPLALHLHCRGLPYEYVSVAWSTCFVGLQNSEMLSTWRRYVKQAKINFCLTSRSKLPT